MAERHAAKQARENSELISRLQRLASVDETKYLGVSFPCNNLPVAENNQFFGRRDILSQLEDHLRPRDTNRLASIALHDLGGVGKTQIGLAYAYSKLKDLDAVVAAQDQLSIRQSFSRIAVDALQLPNASPQSHEENMLLVRLWLQKTSKDTSTRRIGYTGELLTFP